MLDNNHSFFIVNRSAVVSAAKLRHIYCWYRLMFNE